jgi:putative RecB family exonuclease
MVIYSHSRLSTFEQCPQKFKLHYIDKIETEVKESVEAFMGVRIHETLEKLYSDLRYQKKNTLEELIGFLDDEWEKNWNDAIVIVKRQYNSDNYLNMARKFVTDYYNRYDPFDQTKTISIEERILINLDDSGEYKLQGYIDRLTEVKDDYYEIHDYKTNSRLPLLEYIDNDRQLALYSIGVKNRYPDAKDVRLIWHFLAFNKEIDSTRTDEELENLKQNTIQLIDIIESEEQYLTNPSRLCDWCEYKEICREWSHLYSIKDKPANEYLGNPGVQLVNRYAELKAKQKQVKLDLYAEIYVVSDTIEEYPLFPIDLFCTSCVILVPLLTLNFSIASTKPLASLSLLVFNHSSMFLFICLFKNVCKDPFSYLTPVRVQVIKFSLELSIFLIHSLYCILILSFT